jgi:putative addiction module component (TIGR02574 family)
MTAQALQVLQEVLVWPPTERASLIDALFQSFDTKQQLEIEGAWVRESEDRLAAYHAGEMSAMSIDEAMQRINKL